PRRSDRGLTGGLGVSAVHPVRGIASIRGRSSLISNQAAFSLVQTCRCGRPPGSWSRVPRRMRRTAGSAAVRLYIGEPQRPQKARTLPGDDSYSITASPPLVKRCAAAATLALAANAEPLARRHSAQWQKAIGPI